MTATIGKDGYCTRCQLVAEWCECPPPEPAPAAEPGKPRRVPNRAPPMAPGPAPAEPPDGRDETGLTAIAAARLDSLRGALLDSAALDTIGSPRPVIDGMLYRDSLAWLHGKPGTYKSFIALDWAACVDAGLPWQDHETTCGAVLYLIAEGAAGLLKRVRAWEDRAGFTTGVRFLPVVVQLLNPVDLGAFTGLVGELQPVLVIIDTQARVTLGAEENSAMEMGRLVAATEQVRAARPERRAANLSTRH
jgi:AAA domain